MSHDATRAALPVDRFLLLVETPGRCAERLRRRGFAADVAEEIAIYLAQADDLLRLADAIAAAFEPAGVAVLVTELDDRDRWLPFVLRDPARTIVWNATDGIAWYRGSFAASTARLLGCRTYGSPPAVQHLAQDKVATGALAAASGTRVPATVATEDGTWLGDPAPLEGAASLFVKPATLGAKLGIWPESRCRTTAEALQLSRRIHARYRDRAVVQAYVDGADLRVSAMATDAPHDRSPPLGIYRVDTRAGGETGGAFATLRDSLTLSYLAEASGDPGLAVRLHELAMGPSHTAARDAVARFARLVGLRDIWSMDLRLDAAGDVWFLELECCPAVTIYDFRRYLRDHHALDLPAALARGVLLAAARTDERGG